VKIRCRMSTDTPLLQRWQRPARSATTYYHPAARGLYDGRFPSGTESYSTWAISKRLIGTS